MWRRRLRTGVRLQHVSLLHNVTSAITLSSQRLIAGQGLTHPSDDTAHGGFLGDVPRASTGGAVPAATAGCRPVKGDGEAGGGSGGSWGVVPPG
jgi:hypothetical protein